MRILSFFHSSWNRLSTYSGKRRLNLFSMALLLGLDIFVLFMLFDGLNEASRSIASPVNNISMACTTATEDFLKSSASERAETMQRYVLAKHNEDNQEVDPLTALGFGSPEVLSVCETVHRKLRTIVGNAEFMALTRHIEKTESGIRETDASISELKSTYGDALLEKIAGQAREDSPLPAEASKVKSALLSHEQHKEQLQKQLKQQHEALENHSLIRDYVSYLSTLPIASDFAAERARYQHDSFWYPVKTFALQAAFLAPMLLLAILWNLSALKRGRENAILISSHLTLVAAIPALTRLVVLAYDLLPHHLLAELIATLEKLNLGFLWNYVAIFAAIGGGLLLIVFTQKTFFSAARQRAKRLRKNQCHECGEPLGQYQQSHCGFCGSAQLHSCQHCHSPTRRLAFHCEYCGEAQHDATLPVA